MLPQILNGAGISKDSLFIEDDVWKQIVRPLGFDAGIRTLERTIDGITRKVARQIVEGKVKEVKLTPENVKQYLPQ